MSVRSTLTRASVLVAAGLAVALALSACGSSSDPLASSSSAARPRPPRPAPGRRPPAAPIVIGSANFPESSLIANIYAEALKAKGVDVSTNLNIGSRAVYIKALQDGSIDLVPEYTGVLLQYFDTTATAVSSDDVYAALQTADPSGLKVLDKSPAEDKDAIVVTKETADANNLKSIADLAPVASTLVLGGPPEFQTRPDGVPGLQAKYGLTFKEFKALDVGGPLTVGALTSGQVQAGNLFTTDPAIPANDFVVLEDPKNRSPAQNVLPLISAAQATPEVTAALNAVSAKLDTAIADRSEHQGLGRQAGLGPGRAGVGGGEPPELTTIRAYLAVAGPETVGRRHFGAGPIRGRSAAGSSRDLARPTHQSALRYPLRHASRTDPGDRGADPRQGSAHPAPVPPRPGDDGLRRRGGHRARLGPAAGVQDAGGVGGRGAGGRHRAGRGAAGPEGAGRGRRRQEGQHGQGRGRGTVVGLRGGRHLAARPAQGAAAP